MSVVFLALIIMNRKYIFVTVAIMINLFEFLFVKLDNFSFVAMYTKTTTNLH